MGHYKRNTHAANSRLDGRNAQNGCVQTACHETTLPFGCGCQSYRESRSEPLALKRGSSFLMAKEVLSLCAHSSCDGNATHVPKLDSYVNHRRLDAPWQEFTRTLL